MALRVPFRLWVDARKWSSPEPSFATDLIRRQATRVFSALMLVMGLAPILAPLIGGAIIIHLGWRAIFDTPSRSSQRSVYSIVFSSSPRACRPPNVKHDRSARQSKIIWGLLDPSFIS